MNLDNKLRSLLETKGWNLSVPWFLCTSVLYYRWNESVLSDEVFDWMAKGMLERWKAIKHPHKRFIKKADLMAGTGYALPYAKLPPIVYGAAYQMLQETRHKPG